MSKKLTLILGGVRSGKSSFAQRLAAKGERVLFLATAQPGDADMEARIQAHRESRPYSWDTLEEPLDIVAALKPVVDGYDIVILECLTLWVSNLMLRGPSGGVSESYVASGVQELLDLYRQGNASWMVVSNEVGMGIIPATELGRRYADVLGRVNQQVAAFADVVYFMAAGIPLSLKAGTDGR